MDCVNHSGTPAAAYCQNCGKALCEQCARKGMSLGSATQVFCEECLTAWQQAGQFRGAAFGAPPPGGPNPGLAAALGLIPGVGAMYNGQFFKGLIHVVIFAVLISITDHYDIFGLFIAAWIFYQSFEAYHTAKARRDGQPVPDPLGLNEVSNWLNLSWHSRNPAEEWEKQQQAKAAGQNPAGGNAPNPGGNPGPNPAANPNPGAYQPYAGGPYQSSYQAAYTPPAAGPASGFDPAAPPIPPMPPVPPPHWRRREPVGAVILIGLGLIFLLNQMGYVTARIIEYSWPLALIALGVWMILRRVGDTKGGSR